MQSTVPNDTNVPVTAYEDYENHMVIMKGLGESKGQTHFVITSSKETSQATLSAQNLLGENFVPVLAFAKSTLREWMDALDGVQVEPNRAVTMTGDEVIDLSR